MDEDAFRRLPPAVVATAIAVGVVLLAGVTVSFAAKAVALLLAPVREHQALMRHHGPPKRHSDGWLPLPGTDTLAQVTAADDAVVVLLGQDGTAWPVPGPIPAGRYLVSAKLGGDPMALPAGSVEVPVGGALVIACTTTPRACAAR